MQSIYTYTYIYNIQVFDEDVNLIPEEVYEELEILGDIIITDNFNEINFDDYLSDFISQVLT